jgi:hypothetical protein
MFPRDFAYWLMGYFEISIAAGLIIVQKNEETGDFVLKYKSTPNRKMLDTISKHCDLVLATKGNFKPEYLDFVKWVKTATEFDADLGIIYNKLTKFFVHTIDTSFKTKNNSVLNEIHGSDFCVDDMIMRC